jgi:hypothetical protein
MFTQVLSIAANTVIKKNLLHILLANKKTNKPSRLPILVQSKECDFLSLGRTS